MEFLTLEDVLAIHVDQVSRYGGDASIRDLGLLQSAIAQPQATYGDAYLHAFPFEMAAAYLFHLVMNHPFADGNKRTGTVAALVFLDWHEIEISAEEGELADLTLGVTSGKLTKDDVSHWLEDHRLKSS
ncbi:type II toxin-antitoxin system death-on-curing family toxin [bacterium]|nr:type II toxin-antitoxin system death-on-curing family toxin [bacterium]